jgi:3,4-dihydroxy 2-butanone 4-phosphate synthase / GTP cyclohydrolase II
VSFHEIISSTPEIIEDAKNGRMVILVDDEDRENEGDLVIPAQHATPEAINFMAKHGRGLICLAMERQRVEQLGLPLMSQRNGTRHQTAFTVSIEAREGVTTGISAHDRARTIQVATDPKKGAQDIVTPGHIFPLVARDGGVLVRTGHTEASVDIARLAGLSPAGVICEIMNEDGTMARRDDLIRFAQLHGLKIGTISDLIAYRRRYDRIVERTLETDFNSRYGGAFKLYVYTNRVAHAEHVALVKGDIHGDEPVLVRMHAMNVLQDVLGDATSGHGPELHAAMAEIGRAGRGVVVLIREPLPTSLSDSVQRRIGTAAPAKNGKPTELRDYGVGAQILLDLGVRRMILLSNRKKIIIGLDGYGLSIDGQRPIPLDGI